MKLAEAKNRVKEIDERLSVLKARLVDGPLKAISSFMDEVNEILGERQQLQIAIAKTEAESFLAGSSLVDVGYIIALLQDRLDLLSTMQLRKDLPQEVEDQIFSQIDSYSKLKNLLKNNIEKLYWTLEVEISTNLGTGPQN